MKKEKKSSLTYLLVLIWTLIIFLLSTGSGVQIPITWDSFIGIDKLGHCFIYLVHTFLLYWAFENSGLLKSQQQRKWISFLLSAALGIILEFVQYSFYPNRYFETLDIIANIIGSYFGLHLFEVIKHLNRTDRQ